MLVAIIMAVVTAILVPVELMGRPFRSAYAWAREWLRLIQQLPRLEQAIENIARMIAWTKLTTVIAKRNTNKRFRTCTII